MRVHGLARPPGYRFPDEADEADRPELEREPTALSGARIPQPCPVFEPLLTHSGCGAPVQHLCSNGGERTWRSLHSRAYKCRARRSGPKAARQAGRAALPAMRVSIATCVCLRSYRVAHGASICWCVRLRAAITRPRKPTSSSCTPRHLRWHTPGPIQTACIRRMASPDPRRTAR